MISIYRGGPVGLDTIAATIGEESQTIEDVYEPYLMQIGFLQRTPRGRMVTSLAYRHLGLPVPKSLEARIAQWMKEAYKRNEETERYGKKQESA